MKRIKPFYHRLICQPDLLREETDKGRFYVSPEGKKYPSVTTVLSWYKKDSLKSWRQKVGEDEANRISRMAANRGTKLHSVCEAFLKNDPGFKDNLDFMTSSLFDNIYHILNDHVDNIYMIESKMYSDHLKIAGTVDCIAEFDGRKTVIDFKTSSKSKKEEWIEDYFMQAACYAVMCEERTGMAIPNLTIIIAVEHDVPQVFHQKRNKWIDNAISIIRNYEDYHGL